MPKQPAANRLPHGQRASEGFPRFGAATRRPPQLPTALELRITGIVEEPGVITLDELQALPRREQVCDLHCVTTWSKQGLHWGGWRLADLYNQVIVPRFRPRPEALYLVLFGLDGYCCSLLLEDALQADVLIADTLDGEPLSRVHGAPLRVVSPHQYAYKSLKHLSGIGLRAQPIGLPLGLEHLRGRVAHQERHAMLPAWLVRLPYRALICPTAYFQRRGLTSSHFVSQPTLLDEVMPEFEHTELHDLWLDTDPATAYQTLSATTVREVRLITPLMAVRSLPAFLSGRGMKKGRDTAGKKTVFAALESGGFVRLAEKLEREIVYGVIGRFWKLTDNAPLRSVQERDTFITFSEPGYAKAVMSFIVRAEGRGTRILTETRIQTTDAVSSRSFRRYWRLVQPGSGLIRRSWLAAVRRRLRAGGKIRRST